MFITGQRTADYILVILRIAAVLGVSHKWRNELFGRGLHWPRAFLVIAEFLSSVIYSVHVCHFLLNIQKLSFQTSACLGSYHLELRVSKSRKCKQTQSGGTAQESWVVGTRYSPCAMPNVADSRATTAESHPLTAILRVCVTQFISITSAALVVSGKYGFTHFLVGKVTVHSALRKWNVFTATQGMQSIPSKVPRSSNWLGNFVICY